MLINVTVSGNVRVGERSGLQVIESRIEGGVSGARFEHVSFRDASIGGRIHFRRETSRSPYLLAVAVATGSALTAGA